MNKGPLSEIRYKLPERDIDGSVDAMSNDDVMDNKELLLAINQTNRNLKRIFENVSSGRLVTEMVVNERTIMELEDIHIHNLLVPHGLCSRSATRRAFLSGLDVCGKLCESIQKRCEVRLRQAHHDEDVPYEHQDMAN